MGFGYKDEMRPVVRRESIYVMLPYALLDTQSSVCGEWAGNQYSTAVDLFSWQEFQLSL